MKTRSSSNRVPQGYVLVPLLFLLYTSPLADIIHKHNVSFNFYANDSQIYLTFNTLVENTLLAKERIESCIHVYSN